MNSYSVIKSLNLTEIGMDTGNLSGMQGSEPESVQLRIDFC